MPPTFDVAIHPSTPKPSDAMTDTRETPSDETYHTVAITGSSGLVGSRLRHALGRAGHDARRIVRSRQEAGDNDVYWQPREGTIDIERLEGTDCVVHLAGENVFGRWTEAKKERIMQSRKQGTELLSEALADLDEPPEAFLSASAVGYYGPRGDEWVDETADRGEGFLADVCEAWERATDPAREAGIRTMNYRIGLVLSSDGGALGMMTTPFKLGLGGRIGSGDQYMSWIHTSDLVEAMQFGLFESDLEGPVNAVAPNPVTNETFTDTLGDVLNRPTFVPVPKFAARLAFGEMADETLLVGQRVEPRKLREAGFEWQFDQLEEALVQELA